MGKTDELKLTNADSIAWLSFRGPMMAIALWWLIVGLFAVKKIESQGPSFSTAGLHLLRVWEKE